MAMAARAANDGYTFLLVSSSLMVTPSLYAKPGFDPIKDFIPITPAIAEPTTGESMGQSAEKMAKLNGITRADQDALALASHQHAAMGVADGRLTAELAAAFIRSLEKGDTFRVLD